MINKYLQCILALLFALYALSSHAEPKRLVVMAYQLIGDKGNAKIDSEHQQRLAMADAKLREGLQQKPQYALIGSGEAKAYSQKVADAHHNNSCQSCEVAFAKAINADLILAPWVYRVSNLVLAMNFELIDVNNNKRVYQKTLDFRGDNDQSWQRAISYFLEQIDKTGAK